MINYPINIVTVLKKMFFLCVFQVSHPSIPLYNNDCNTIKDCSN